MTAATDRILRTIASEIRARPEQVKVAVDLFDEGATVPFVARYRKEATGGLDDTQLRQLEERLAYLRELEARRTAILDGIRSQGKLTGTLKRRSRSPSQRPSSRIFICRFGRNAGPAPRSPVNADLDPWQTQSSPIALQLLPNWQWPISPSRSPT